MSCDVLPSIRHFQGGSAIEGAGDERRPAGEFPLGRGTAFDMFQVSIWFNLSQFKSMICNDLLDRGRSRFRLLRFQLGLFLGLLDPRATLICFNSAFKHILLVGISSDFW